jgi:Zn-dependent protease
MSQLALRFHVAGIPVVVEPGFWIIALLLGMSGTPQTLLIWIPAVFFGVLAHELGHALMARTFGAKPDITLYMMGGVTRSIYPQGKALSRLQSGLVTIAGPGAGFLIAGVTFLFILAYRPTVDSTAFQISAVLLWINLGWGILNLVPVLPLDGGNLLRAFLSGPGPEAGMIRTLWVSVVLGPIIAIASWQAGFTWAAMLFGFFTFSSGKQLYDVSRARADQGRGLDRQLEQAHEALMEGHLDRAERLAGEVAQQAKTKMLRVSAVHLLAFTMVERGHPEKALEELEKLPPDQVDPFLWGACLLAVGRPAEAVVPLERAAENAEQPRAFDLLLEALEQSGNQKRADELRRSQMH